MEKILNSTPKKGNVVIIGYGVRLRKAEDRIKRLEKTVAKLIVREADKERDEEVEEERQRQFEDATANIGSDLF